MRIRHIEIRNWRKRKILCKHGVSECEVRRLFEKPHFAFKTRNRCCMAIGCPGRYLTVIFKMEGSIANIITAYPSSENQINLYKRKIK